MERLLVVIGVTLPSWIIPRDQRRAWYVVAGMPLSAFGEAFTKKLNSCPGCPGARRAVSSTSSLNPLWALRDIHRVGKKYAKHIWLAIEESWLAIR